ncbi:hypothetical protein JCM8097_007569 [Rhodosporidiobolus ruineniae]
MGSFLGTQSRHPPGGTGGPRRVDLDLTASDEAQAEPAAQPEALANSTSSTSKLASSPVKPTIGALDDRPAAAAAPSPVQPPFTRPSPPAPPSASPEAENRRKRPRSGSPTGHVAKKVALLPSSPRQPAVNGLLKPQAVNGVVYGTTSSTAQAGEKNSHRPIPSSSRSTASPRPARPPPSSALGAATAAPRVPERPHPPPLAQAGSLKPAPQLDTAKSTSSAPSPASRVSPTNSAASPPPAHAVPSKASGEHVEPSPARAAPVRPAPLPIPPHPHPASTWGRPSPFLSPPPSPARPAQPPAPAPAPPVQTAPLFDPVFVNPAPPTPSRPLSLTSRQDRPFTLPDQRLKLGNLTCRPPPPPPKQFNPPKLVRPGQRSTPVSRVASAASSSSATATATAPSWDEQVEERWSDRPWTDPSLNAADDEWYEVDNERRWKAEYEPKVFRAEDVEPAAKEREFPRSVALPAVFPFGRPLEVALPDPYRPSARMRVHDAREAERAKAAAEGKKKKDKGKGRAREPEEQEQEQPTGFRALFASSSSSTRPRPSNSNDPAVFERLKRIADELDMPSSDDDDDQRREDDACPSVWYRSMALPIARAERRRRKRRRAAGKEEPAKSDTEGEE